MPKRTTMADVLEAVHTLTSHLDQRFDESELKMDLKLEKKLDREEFYRVLGQGKDEITTQINPFITLHQKVDLETVALRSRCDRIENSPSEHGTN